MVNVDAKKEWLMVQKYKTEDASRSCLQAIQNHYKKRKTERKDRADNKPGQSKRSSIAARTSAMRKRKSGNIQSPGQEYFVSRKDSDKSWAQVSAFKQEVIPPQTYNEKRRTTQRVAPLSTARFQEKSMLPDQVFDLSIVFLHSLHN